MVLFALMLTVPAALLISHDCRTNFRNFLVRILYAHYQIAGHFTGNGEVRKRMIETKDHSRRF